MLLWRHERQPDAEGRASGLAVELNLALMFLNNLLANVEAEAAPFACRFGREKRLENAAFDGVGNAGAGIGDFDDNPRPTPTPSQEGNSSTPLLGGVGGGSYVVVEITDSGPGIPDAIKPRIFEPFFTTKPAGEGSGLGLDICRKIIDKHQGKIDFESKTGRTTFRVWLPIIDA